LSRWQRRRRASAERVRLHRTRGIGRAAQQHLSSPPPQRADCRDRTARVTPYELRHAYASLAFSTDAVVKALQECWSTRRQKGRSKSIQICSSVTWTALHSRPITQSLKQVQSKRSHICRSSSGKLRNAAPSTFSVVPPGRFELPLLPPEGDNLSWSGANR
jgi:hypothetical protein